MLLGGLAFMGHRIYEQRKEEARVAELQREVEEKQKEIEEAYRWIHYAIGRLWHGDYWWAVLPEILARESEYRSLESFGLVRNDFGIYSDIYLMLRMYYHRSGNYLSYEALIDYFLEEFEPDGTLRLYNNGFHPEVEAFVVWMREEPRIKPDREGEVIEYLWALQRIYTSYFNQHREQGFRSYPFHMLSPQMYDALARAEADPDYVLDLTSLQEAGY